MIQSWKIRVETLGGLCFMQLLQKKVHKKESCLFCWAKKNAHKEKWQKKIQVVFFVFLHPKKCGENGKHLQFLCHSWWLAFCGAPWCVFCWLLFCGTPSFVCVFPFGSFGSPGITDGGRVTMLHVLRVGIARKFAVLQNNSMGGQAEKNVKQLMLQKSGGHQLIWLPSLKQTARTWNTVVGFDEFPFRMAS